jgi:ribulose-phosphate 3-epimerase
MIDSAGLKTLIEVDGGVNDKNVSALKDAGVDIVVAGNYIFGSSSYKSAIDSLRV